MTSDDLEWVPEACTLPNADRPLRLAEFDDLFATALREQRRLSPTVLRWHLDPAAEATAQYLTGRESSCCSFFTFEFAGDDASDDAGDGAGLRLDVQVPAGYLDVLDALAGRAATGMAG